MTATILVVDDSPTSRLYLSTLLEYASYKVFEACDGREALEKSRAERPNLVISDILMPTIDGYELVRDLRADPQLRDTPVLFYTATYGIEEAGELARAVGVREVLRKPAEPKKILQAVGAALGLPGESALPGGSDSPPASPSTIVENPAPPWLAGPGGRLCDAVGSLGELREHPDCPQLGDDQQEGRSGEWLAGIRGDIARLCAFAKLLHLASEDDPGRLFDAFCRLALEIVPTRQASLLLLAEDERTLRRFVVFDATGDVSSRSSPPRPAQGLLGRVIAERRPVRIQGLITDPWTLGMPPDHPPIGSFLGVPVSTPTRIHGVLYLTRDPGAPFFSQEDESAACLLGSQIAVRHESLVLSDVIRRHSVRLQLEVTERELMSEELRRRAEELARSNAELESYAYLASHDLQEPLRMVTSHVQLLAKRCAGKLDAESMELIAFTVEGAARMHRLVSDLLTYAQAGIGGSPRSQLQSEEVLARATASLQTLIEETGAVLTHETLPSVRADAGMLERVFQNLIGNALKFRRQGETPHVHVSAEKDEKGWTFSVRDNGIGIETRHTERIFALFQRLHSRETYAGTGIGLSLCRKLVERRGGRIWVESEPGEGSVFRFTIPFEAPLRAVAEATAAPEDGISP